MSDPQFLLRLPEEMHESLSVRAQQNGRSMAAEIRNAIEKHLADGNEFEKLKARVKKLEDRLR